MDYQKHAMLLEVIRSLGRRNCSAGKTNVQKALAIMNETVQKTPFGFVLYKHGPYSFDVQATMEQMKTYRAIVSQPNVDGFGINICEGPGSKFVDKNADLPIETKQAIEKVCEFVCSRSVFELERLATAAWIRKREGLKDSFEVAARLNQLKPHVSIDDATTADEELIGFFAPAL